ncbi:TetR/AcrR family transcriptional regulator [Kitasatospora azatica]|uniref:TetR/AcrR family transcriptional regulator n=1 Tax=Kitasatospora azatica TaxID=58347 RepID=UPI0005605B67|nr:TetR/AcrR family transcriptional regulator [Kitasatospora azatica]
MAEKPHDPTVSIWLSSPRPRKRGSAPTGLSRDRIIATAVALLDAEGVQAFSMRKLAAELEVTPMSVYWYVDNKDELLELALDAAFGEMRVPPLEDHGDWRRHIYVMVHEYRTCYLRHPWAAELAGRYLAIGPNAMLMSTSAVSALSGTGLRGDQLSGALALLFQYAYGFARAEAQWNQRVRLAGTDETELFHRIYGAMVAADPRHAEVDEVLEFTSHETVEIGRNRQFDAGLELAMAGIEAAIAQLPDRQD